MRDRFLFGDGPVLHLLAKDVPLRDEHGQVEHRDTDRVYTEYGTRVGVHEGWGRRKYEVTVWI